MTDSTDRERGPAAETSSDDPLRGLVRVAVAAKSLQDAQEASDGAAAGSASRLADARRGLRDALASLGDELAAAARVVEADRACYQALESITVRCREGDPRTDWLPTIDSIASAALESYAKNRGQGVKCWSLGRTGRGHGEGSRP